MINQSKINSFISQVAKGHSQKKHIKYYTGWTKSHFPTEQSSHQIFKMDSYTIENNHSWDEGLRHEESRYAVDDSIRGKIQMLINQSIKEKQKKHKCGSNNLYALYRQSVQKKKTNFLKGHNQTYMEHNDSTDQGKLLPGKYVVARNSKQVSFPIRGLSPKKTNNGKFGSFTIKKKRQLTSPCGYLRCNQVESTKKVKTQPVEDEDLGIPIRLEHIEPKQKLGKQTIFRIQRCMVSSKESETLEKMEGLIGQLREGRKKNLNSPRQKRKSISLGAIHTDSKQTSGLKHRYSRRQDSTFRFDLQPWQHEEQPSNRVNQFNDEQI